MENLKSTLKSVGVTVSSVLCQLAVFWKNMNLCLFLYLTTGGNPIYFYILVICVLLLNFKNYFVTIIPFDIFGSPMYTSPRMSVTLAVFVVSEEWYRWNLFLKGKLSISVGGLGFLAIINQTFYVSFGWYVIDTFKVWSSFNLS